MQVESIPRVLKLSEVLGITKLSQASLYRLAKSDDRLSPFKLGEHASGWEAQGVEGWLRERIAAKSADSAKATGAAKKIRSFRAAVTA